MRQQLVILWLLAAAAQQASHSAPVSPSSFKYYPRNSQSILIRFDSNHQFNAKDFQVSLDYIAALAYLGYHPVIAVPPSGQSTTVCSSKHCFIDRSKDNHIELIPAHFDTILETSARMGHGILKNCSAAYTFSNSAVPQLPAVDAEFNAYVCLHPCALPRNADSGVERISKTSRYSLIVVFSEYSREKYLHDLRDDIVSAGAIGVTLPLVKPVRLPIPEDLTFEVSTTATASGHVSLSEFRVLVGHVEISVEWLPALSIIVRSYGHICAEMFQNSTLCEIYFICDGTSEIDAAVMHQLKALSINLMVQIATIDSRNVSDIKRLIHTAYQYLAVSGAPQYRRAMDIGDIFSHEPTDLIDPLALFSLLCGIPAIHLAYGAAAELMPTVKRRGKNVLVISSLDQLQQSVEFIIKRIERKNRLPKFRDYASKAVQGIGIKSVVSVLGKLMQKYPIVAKYDHFVKDKIQPLRQILLTANPRGINVAVCIESSLHPNVEFAIRNVLLHLGPSWAMCIFHSAANEQFMKHLLADITGITFIPIDGDVQSRRQYSLWMKTPTLWKQLRAMNYRHVLVFQPDSLMLRGDIDTYLAYDYIGAPWCISPLSKLRTKSGIGNGGFSLRNITAMLEITTHATDTFGVEDFFFVTQMEAQPTSYRLPSRVTAYNFAREFICLDEFGSELHMSSELQNESVRPVPLGVHAAWLFAEETGSARVVWEWLHSYYAGLAN